MQSACALAVPCDYNVVMERESLEYRIVMEDGPDTEVLGRLANLEMANAAYHQGIVKYPLRNVRLCRGEEIIKRHDGEPKPAPPPDPNARSSTLHWRQADGEAGHCGGRR